MEMKFNVSKDSCPFDDVSIGDNDEWETDRDDLKIDEKSLLGSGAFSNVYLGILHLENAELAKKRGLKKTDENHKV